QRIRQAAVPVAVWVGPSGAEARGGATRLVAAAAVVGQAPGSRIRPRVVPTTARVFAPTLGDFIVGLDGRTVGGRTLATAKVVQRGDQPRREPSVRVRFAKLGLVPGPVSAQSHSSRARSRSTGACRCDGRRWRWASLASCCS